VEEVMDVEEEEEVQIVVVVMMMMMMMVEMADAWVWKDGIHSEYIFHKN